MFIIKNKLRILSAVILAIASSATVLSSCGGNKTAEDPSETITGAQGEILGVYVYTNEDSEGTQTYIFEITKNQFANKLKKGDKTIKAEKNPGPDSEKINLPENNGTVADNETQKPGKKMTVRNNSHGVTLKPQRETEPTSKQRPTFPKTTQKTSREAPSFAAKETTQHVPVSYVPATVIPKATKPPIKTTSKQTQAHTRAETQPAYDEKVSENSEGVNIVFKTESVEKGTTASIMIQGQPGKKYSIDFYTSATDTADYSGLEDQTADENGFVTWTFNIPSNCSSGSKKVIVKEKGTNNFAQTSINIR